MRSLLALAVVLAVAVFMAGAALDRREVAFTTNLPALDLVKHIEPGEELCTDAVDVPASFQRVRLVVGRPLQPAQPLRLVLTDEAARRPRGIGRFPGGDSNRGGNVELAVGDVASGGRLSACVTNEGDVPQPVFGAPPNRDAAQPPQFAVVFVREPAPTLLSLLPTVFERSAVFKPGFYGAWTTWALLVVGLLMVPLALSRALTAAYASERSYSGDDAVSDGRERSS